jgi:hypothetical protein
MFRVQTGQQQRPAATQLPSYARDGVITATFEPWPEHDNGMGYLNGGIVSTLLDCHSAAAVASRPRAERYANCPSLTSMSGTRRTGSRQREDIPVSTIAQVAVTPIVLAGLADRSMLAAIAWPSGSRHRALEAIRQSGVARLDVADELRVAQEWAAGTEVIGPAPAIAACSPSRSPRWQKPRNGSAHVDDRRPDERLEFRPLDCGDAHPCPPRKLPFRGGHGGPLATSRSGGHQGHNVSPPPREGA